MVPEEKISALIAQWREVEEPGVLTETGLAAEQARVDCADELEAVLSCDTKDDVKMPCPHCGLFSNHLDSCEYEKLKALVNAGAGGGEAREGETTLHEPCHDLVCNGDRRFAVGVPGHGCSCGTRERRERLALESARPASPAETLVPRTNRSLHEQINCVTRIEVIDDNSRQFTRWNTRIGLSFQDDGRTLKVFVGDRARPAPREDA